MANQIIIDIGAVANDGTGDPLRTAFGYVNDNFSNVWATGVANANIGFSGNKILTVNTNGNLVLAPNGTGKVIANVDIVPNTANVRNLGAINNRWSTVYTQYINVSGDTTLTGDVTIGGNLTVEGDTIQIGNITTDTKTIQLANTANTANAANGSGVTVGANDNIATMLYNSTSNTWVMNIGANITGNVTAPYFIGNGSQLTGITSYANANAVAYGQAGWAGNIIPATSNTYSLGNATNQWNDLYVSNATIYMNNVPLSLTAGNVLTINGEAVLSNDSDTDITTTGNITANIVTATESADLGSLRFYASSITMNDNLWDYINISPAGEGWAYLQLPKDSVANVQDTRLHNDAGNIEFGTGQFSTSGPGYTWTLDNTGNLNVPVNINFNGGGIQQVLNEDFYTRVSDDEDEGWSIYNVVDDGAGTTLTQTRIDSDGFYIRTDVAGSDYQWNFNSYQGITNFPGNLQGPYGSDSSFYAYDTGSGGMVEMKTISYIGDTLLANVTVRHPNVTISTQNSAYTWTFDGTGNLVLPASGNLVGATANNSGHINWLGNSSGDGFGYTTMHLVPDDVAENYDGYLIIDPTAPSHIHIRAGGTQDNSGAQLYLGGENSYFKVDNGSNPNVYVASNSNVWRFGTDGNLVVPNSIKGTNSGAPIVIDAGATGDSYISIPSFTDGGEQLVIKNKYFSSQGIRFETESGNFLLSGASLTFPDSTVQTTAYTGATYSDSNVTTLLSSLGANTISSTANIATTGNVLSLTSTIRNGDDAVGTNNKTQVKFGYNGTELFPQWIQTRHNSAKVNNTIDFYTGDGTESGTFPANAILGGSITQGAMQMAVYANTTVRDSTITSPTPGMMIYVTGTGMQVYGATQWNTIAGSGT